MEVLTKPPGLLNTLHTFDIFKDIDPEVVQWVHDVSEYHVYKKGEKFFEPGDSIDHMVINMSGEWAIQIKQDNTYRDYQNVFPGTISGLLPYSRLKTAQGYGVAIKESEALLLHKRNFPELGIKSPELMQALVTAMMDRVRDYTQFKNQNEKLLSLGKLSAGLAHELNNPASAMVRSAQELRTKIHHSPEKFKQVTAIRMSPEHIDAVNQVLFSKIEQDYTCTLTMIERTDLEDEYIDWLEERGVKDPEEVAVTFVESGMKQEDLDELESLLPAEYIGPVLGWIESTLSLERLIKEIQDSADRISKLVTSVKAYSHMDRGQDKEAVDIHEGIRSTIIMMKHKLKDKKIQVVENYDESSPNISLHVGEMNQVWTNLIDNAIDAMDPEGTLTITSLHNAMFKRIEVDLADNGSGISEEIQNKIFDPFFTTKGVGEGTGIGLDTSLKIVKRHGGIIELTSQPGKTVFKVCLPLVS